MLQCQSCWSCHERLPSLGYAVKHRHWLHCLLMSLQFHRRRVPSQCGVTGDLRHRIWQRRKPCRATAVCTLLPALCLLRS